jgi:hypothetical protein
MNDKWRTFWHRALSPQTARFILALFAQTSAVGVTVYVIRGGVDASLENALMFALGQLFALSGVAYNYYFGSTARNDEKPLDVSVTNPPDDPVPVDSGG